jgi:predicted ABC-type ATPase
MPWMWIVAGPNGAGKSTLTALFLKKLGNPDLIKLNADEVTAALRAKDAFTEQSALNLRAAQMIDKRVEDCITESQDFLVETVLSSRKYRDDLERAKDAGYKIGLIYVSLYPPQLSPLRVDERVRLGGQAVDPETAISRYWRSHEQLSWFVSRVDTGLIYDNSDHDCEPRLLARVIQNGKRFEIFSEPTVNPAVYGALKKAADDLPSDHEWVEIRQNFTP